MKLTTEMLDLIAEAEQEARLMRARMERLQGERDELLAALAKIDNLKPTDFSRDCDMVIACLRIARDAIAKVEGRA